LPKQNYGYEKRQKELAKQKKKEAKRQRKQGKNVVPPEENREQSSNEVEPA